MSTEIRHSELGWTFFRSSLLGVDINRAWNMPVGGFIQELKSLKEEVKKINEVSWRQRNLEFGCYRKPTWKVGIRTAWRRFGLSSTNFTPKFAE